MAAMLLCVSGMMAAVGGKLRIPAMDHMTVVVTRGSETLADGDSVWSGDVLHASFTPDEGYCIGGPRVYHLERTLTLTDNDFCQDWTFLADGESQGFIKCAAGGDSFLGYAADGWKHRFPGYSGATSEVSTLSFTPPVTGTVTFSIIRGMNSDFTQWGQFKLYWSKNGTVQTTAVRDFTSTYNRPGHTLLYDTLTVTLSEGDVLGFTGEKVNRGTWLDDGRWWYIGSIHLLGGGDYFLEPIGVEQMYQIFFSRGEHINVSATVTEDGRAITDGGYAPWDRHVSYSFTPAPGYRFTDGSTSETKEVMLNGDLSGYNESAKRFTISCTKTAELDVELRYPVIITLADHVNLDSISLDGQPFAGGDSAKVDQVLYYRLKTDAGWTFLDQTTEKEFTVTLTEALLETVGSDKRFAFTTEVPEQIQQYTLIFNLAEHVSLDSISLNNAPYTLGDNVSTGDQLYCRFRTDDGWIFSDATTVKESTVTISAAMADADKKITINCPAAQQIIYYTLIFDIPEHASLKSVKINGANWDGGTVVAGDVVDYEFVAEKHYKFEGRDDDYIHGSRTIFADMANENNEIIISCPAAIFVPGVKLQFVATTHNSLKYAKLNGVDYDGGYAWNGDTIDFAFVADNGYDFYEITHDEGSLELGAKMPVDVSMADADSIIKFECPPASLRPEFVLSAYEAKHTTLTLEVNGQPFENGGIVRPIDTVFYQYVADYGYEFYNGDTIYDNTLVISRGMATNDTIRVFYGYGDATIKNPQITVEMLDSTTAHISWTGIFTESKILVTPVSLEGVDPRYAKGFTFVNERELVVDTLTPGETYYIYLVGTKPEMSEVAYIYFQAIYKEGGESEWTPSADCGFTISMTDSWGDGWNGNALRFVEDGNEQLFTIERLTSERIYYSATATYESAGKEVSIYFVEGSYKSEIGATVTDAFGSVVLEIEPGEASNYQDGQLLFSGVLCNGCKAMIEDDAIYEADSTSFSISWSAVNSIAYDVVVTQKSNPKAAELETLAVRQESTSFAWTGEPLKGYNVFVRGICADSVPGAWKRFLVYEQSTTNPEPWARLHAKTVTPDYTETGDLLQNAMITNDGYGIMTALCYKLSLADTTDAVISFELEHQTSNYSYGVVLADTAANGTDPMALVQFFMPGDTLRNLVDGEYILVFTEDQLDEYTFSLKTPKYLVAKPMVPDFTETGDFTEALMWPAPFGGEYPTVLYSYTPTDSAANVMLSLTTTAYGSTGMIYSPFIYYIVYRDTLDYNHIIYSDPVGEGTFPRKFEMGHTYYVEIILDQDNGGELTDDYTITLKHVVPLPTKVITLDFVETGDYTDAVEWTNPYFGMETYAKAYSFTPTDSVEVLLTINGNNALSGAGIFLFRNEISPSTMFNAVAVPTIGSMMCAKDSTYILVLSSLPMYGGKRTDTYELRIEQLKEQIEPEVTAVIEPDTIIRDILTLDDYSSTADNLIKIYEYVAYRNEQVSFGLFVNDTIAGIPGGIMYMPFYGYVYKDSLNFSGSSFASIGTSMTVTTLSGSKEGTHYYFVIAGSSSMALLDLPFNFHFRREMDYDNPNVLQTVEVGQNYTRELTFFDEYTYHYWPGSAQSFEFHAEKGKTYKIYMRATNPNYSGGTLYASVLDTRLKKGSFDGNRVSTDYTQDANWGSCSFTPDSTGNYVVMFDTYFSSSYMNMDTLGYEFLITEYIEFWDMIADAEYVATPYSESGVFTSASTKVFYNTEYAFHYPYSSTSSAAGIYNAKAYMVIVPAGQDLFVEFGSQKDVEIFIYDFSTESTAHYPSTFDDYSYAYPYETGYFYNSSSTSKMVYVVVSQSKMDLGDDEWSLRIGIGLQTLESDIAKAVASQDKVTIYNNQGELEAVAALSALQLSAIDAATGATIGSIRNNSAYWVVDLLNNKARFEANDSDLPVGYRFAEATEWIEVSIEVLPYGEGIDNVDEEETVEVRKFLHNGHIYIQTPNGIFTITGQRVK